MNRVVPSPPRRGSMCKLTGGLREVLVTLAEMISSLRGPPWRIAILVHSQSWKAASPRVSAVSVWGPWPGHRPRQRIFFTRMIFLPTLWKNHRLFDGLEFGDLGCLAATMTCGKHRADKDHPLLFRTLTVPGCRFDDYPGGVGIAGATSPRLHQRQPAERGRDRRAQIRDLAGFLDLAPTGLSFSK